MSGSNSIRRHSCSLGHGHGVSEVPYGADLVQRPLDHLERRIDGSIRGGTALGHLEELASHLELHTCYLLTFVLHQGHPRFNNVVIWRVEGFESLRNPPQKMWRQPGVLTFNV